MYSKEQRTKALSENSEEQGEITPAVLNEAERNFHSDNPGELLLSDISEFAIPAGKV